jgi:hypothetical protein
VRAKRISTPGSTTKMYDIDAIPHETVHGRTGTAYFAANDVPVASTPPQ